MSDHDELFARLRDADPAAPLDPVDPERVARLLEDAMSHDTLTESRETGARHRSPLTWLVAAAAVVLIAGVGAFALWGGEDGSPASPPTAAEGGPTVTDLTVPASGTSRCMVPTARVLSNAEVAVEATVVAVESGVVTLDVSHWYAGEPTDQVRVDQASADRSALVGAPEFEDGGHYLVAGSAEGDLMVCGFSGAYSEDLATMYAEAFGG
jgi:hypothetical protein